mgnify:CR=1 FL=1
MADDKGIQKIFQRAIDKSEKLNEIVKDNFKDMLRNAPVNLVELLKEALAEVENER